MARDAAPRLTFCYGGDMTEMSQGRDVKGWAGDARSLWTHGDKPRRGSSLSLFVDPTVAAGLIRVQSKEKL